MIIHIVKSNERLIDIINFYSLSFDDLKVNNLHITDFNNILPGTKLKIPTLTSENIQILNNTEPLVSDYYDSNINIPKINDISSIENNNSNNFKGINVIKPSPINNIFKRKSIYPFYKKEKDE